MRITTIIKKKEKKNKPISFKGEYLNKQSKDKLIIQMLRLILFQKMIDRLY